MTRLMKVGYVVALAAFVASAAPLGTAVAKTNAAVAGVVIKMRASQAPPADDQSMVTMHQNMMATHKKMMAETSASDARLQQLADKMNAAKGEAKIEAMGAVLTELIQQQKASRAQMPQMMMPGMMSMMGMMQGMNDQMRQMMAQCPMMKNPGQPSSPNP